MSIINLSPQEFRPPAGSLWVQKEKPVRRFISVGILAVIGSLLESGAARGSVPVSPVPTGSDRVGNLDVPTDLEQAAALLQGLLDEFTVPLGLVELPKNGHGSDGDPAADHPPVFRR